MNTTNGETIRAFLAGALLPSIAFYFWNTWYNKKKTVADEDDDDDDDELYENVDERILSSETILPCSQWNRSHAPYKMLFIVNMELSMGKGKIAAQCGHAAVGCYQRGLRHCPTAIAIWERIGCAKIAVKCPTTQELEELMHQALAKNIPYYLVEDAGRTQIAAGSRTVLGLFGPVQVFEGFTDHLKLM